jgi:energy-converting hydrogenase Eha subunit G
MDAAVVERVVEGIAFVGFFAAAVTITKILADNWTKRRLTAAHVSDETIRALYARDREGAVSTALRWGLVLCGVGVALVMIQFLPFDFTDPIAYGLMLLLAGGGLLAHYAILGRATRQKVRSEPPADRHDADTSA